MTPSPVQRLEALRLPDWERQGRESRVPRSSLAPILRFADVEAFVLAAPDGGNDGTQLDAFVQVGVAKEDQPHYLKVLARPGADVVPLLRFGLGVIAARAEAAPAHRQGVLAPVRTYESPVDRRLEEEGFDSIAIVTLLMKETLVRVAEPRLVPAGVRWRAEGGQPAWDPTTGSRQTPTTSTCSSRRCRRRSSRRSMPCPTASR